MSIDVHETGTPAVVEAPWTPAQVEALNLFQRAGFLHPYTCDRTGHPEREGVLVASTDGWSCPVPGCGYVQRWALAMAADLEAVRAQRERYVALFGQSAH